MLRRPGNVVLEMDTNPHDVCGDMLLPLVMCQPVFLTPWFRKVGGSVEWERKCGTEWGTTVCLVSIRSMTLASHSAQCCCFSFPFL